MQFTSENIQRYARMALHWVAAALVSRGVISPDATWLEPVIGALVGLASFAWSLYGNSVQAKINEVAKIEIKDAGTGETKKLVADMKLTDVAVAAAAPANVVPAPTAT